MWSIATENVQRTSPTGFTQITTIVNIELKSVSLQSSFHIIVIIGSDRLVQIAETSLPRLLSEITLTEREKTARNTAILTIIMFEYIIITFLQNYYSSWNNDACIANAIFANLSKLSSTEHFPANKLKASFLSYLYRVSTKFLIVQLNVKLSATTPKSPKSKQQKFVAVW